MTTRIPTTGTTIPTEQPEQPVASLFAAAAQPLLGDFAALAAAVDEPEVVEDTREPITLDQAKKHLRVVVPDDDDYIAGLIVAARQMAEGRLNRTIVQRQRTLTFEPGETCFRLLKPPVVSVDAIEVTNVARERTVLADEDYYLHVVGEDAAPSLRPAPGATWASRSTVAVTYTAGYAPGQVPHPIVQWMLLVIGTLYENRETESAGVQLYSISENFMKWLLQPYMVYE